MNKKWITIGIIALVIVIIAGAFIGNYNSLANKLTAVEDKQANIQAELQRRSDLIPNLVETVKGYASHESETLQAVTDARTRLANATTPSEMASANAELDKALSIYVNAVTEAYPELKANENFKSLQSQLETTENRVVQARRTYNEAVTDYNGTIRRFPSNLFAGMFGFEKAELFEANADAQEAPSVSFN